MTERSLPWLGMINMRPLVRLGSHRGNNSQCLQLSTGKIRLDLQAILFCGLFSGLPSVCLAEATQHVPPPSEIKTMIEQGERLRERGELVTAQQQFDTALALLNGSTGSDKALLAQTQAASGYNLFLLNIKDVAERQLKEAYQSTQSGQAYLHGLIGQYLGLLHLAEGDPLQAKSYYDAALLSARESGDQALQLSLELANLGLDDTRPPATIGKQLSELANRVNGLPNGYLKAKLQLRMAQNILALDQTQLDIGLNSAAFAALNQALEFAEISGAQRLKAEVTGSLALLYRLNTRIDEALVLTHRAIELARAGQHLELTAQFEALRAQLLQIKGDKSGALLAYERAVKDLLAVREDLPIGMPDGKSSIDEVIDPIHRGYVDALLQSVSDGDASQTLLLKAIDSMEAIKEADLQDFFLGRCAIAAKKQENWLFNVFPETVVVYPILLKDRLELMVKIGSVIHRRSVAVDAAEVKEQTLLLTQKLHGGKDYRPAAKQLYHWLYEPIQPLLEKAGSKLIVYVPDRSLRAVPYGVLSNGKQFLVEHYAIVTQPGLSFQNLDQHTLGGKSERTLVAGLSRPDSAAIDRLPEPVMEQLSRHVASEQGLPAGKTQVDRAALMKELSLPNIENEVGSVAKDQNGTTLLNDQFTASALKSDIETGNYDKVHIASHGYFGKNAKDSFVMAYDRNLTLMDFEGSLGAEQLKREPIDLLTLSACETAEGDDRMLLGFSGLAVKSNVLSAVGSLWSINDQAAAEFMRLFYEGLRQSLNKAQAMQQAQVTMIKSQRFRHPFYWSPFILIGGWQ